MEKDSSEPEYKAALFVDGVFAGNSFTENSRLGAKKAAEEFGIPFIAMESIGVSSAENTFMSMVAEGYNLFILPGFTFADTITNIAPQLPDVKFLIFDVKVEGFDNIQSITFREQEMTFLSGVYSALIDEGDKFGFIGAVKSVVLDRWEAGYIAGVKAIRPEANIMSVYTGSWADVVKTKEIASVMYNQGSRIIFPGAGGGNIGLYEYMKDHPGKGYYTFGGGVDGEFNLAPDYIAAGVVKKIDNVIYNTVKDVIEGKFIGSVAQSVGLKEGGLDFIYNNNELFDSISTAKVIKVIEEYRESIIDMSIIVPDNPEDAMNFNSIK